MCESTFLSKHLLIASIITLWSKEMGVGGSNIIYARINHAVNFHLPTFNMCGSYSFNNNYDMEAFRVLNVTHVNISNPGYRNRSTVTPSSNELVWTLHDVKTTDLGSYALRMGTRLIQKDGCDTIYELQDARVVAEWGTWSACDVICGDGRQIRQRLDNGEREQRRCSAEPCEWSRWSQWSECSGSTCDRTRYRVCWNGETHQRVNDTQCGTNNLERESCLPDECRDRNEVKPPSVSETNSDRKEMTVELPVSYIVGGISVLFILVLIVVIALLVNRLRKRQGKRNMKEKSNNTSDVTDKKTKAYKERAISMAVSSHCYDEIDYDEFDSDVSNDVKKTERMSVLTIDNTYVALPQSASPTCQYTNQTIWNSVTYNNERPSVFMFGEKANESENDVMGKSGPSTNKKGAPRHMSVDSVGYLLPGAPDERALRTKKFTKQ